MPRTDQPKRIEVRVRLKPDIRERLRDASDRRLLSQSRITELALAATLDRFDAEDAVAIRYRQSRQRLEDT